MTLRDVVKQYFYELDDGISWILIYKDGRSWFGVSLYTDDVDYNLSDGFSFSEPAMKLLHEVYQTDKNTILVNGYYMNIGWSETERNTIQRFVDGIKRQYELSIYNHQLEYLL